MYDLKRPVRKSGVRKKRPIGDGEGNDERDAHLLARELRLILAQRLVGRDLKGAHTEYERFAERGHAARDRHLEDRVALHPTDEREGVQGDRLVWRRTATAQLETPRIMTPSMTAWPPTSARRAASGNTSAARSHSRPRLLAVRWVLKLAAAEEQPPSRSSPVGDGYVDVLRPVRLAAGHLALAALAVEAARPCAVEEVR